MMKDVFAATMEIILQMMEKWLEEIAIYATQSYHKPQVMGKNWFHFQVLILFIPKI